MSIQDKTAHWNQIYTTKKFEDVSWYLESPNYFIDLIEKFASTQQASIIDVGCGESRILPTLKNNGFTNLYGLDISEVLVSKVQQQYPSIHWVCSDITAYQPNIQFDVWNDRAVFHFLTDEADIMSYVQLCARTIKPQGIFILSTFSKNGPLKCSGLPITQYNHEDINVLFREHFDIMEQTYHVHTTPSGSEQHFQTTIMKRK